MNLLDKKLINYDLKEACEIQETTDTQLNKNQENETFDNYKPLKQTNSRLVSAMTEPEFDRELQQQTQPSRRKNQ